MVYGINRMRKKGKNMKKIIILSSIFSGIISFGYADSNSTTSLSKVERLELLKKEEKKRKEEEKLMSYDTIAVEMSIEDDIKTVKELRKEVLDMLGPNKDCYVVADRIRQLEEKIQKYEPYKDKAKSKKEIDKSIKIINKAKLECPNYLNFKGDNK
jgi:hypothetical protein